MRTANPALSEKAFRSAEYAPGRTEVMTVAGTTNKTLILLALVIIAAFWTWHLFFTSESPAAIMPWFWGGLIGGFIFAMITIFSKKAAPITAPIYAILEGFFLGSISAIFETQYSGIVLQAVGLTFGIMFCMLVLYKSGTISVTEKFKMGVVAATGAVFLVYFSSFVLSFFGVRVPYIHEGGYIGIGFSVVVIIIASLNLVLDFDFIEKGSRAGAPKYMEWYGAFGLMVTLIWLYIEILRLLAKLSSRR